MAIITAYCAEAHGLKLGPGIGNVQVAGEVIVFERGYASFDEKDFPEWRLWALKGAPHIEVLDAGEVPASETSEFVCPVDGKAFETQQKLNGHRMSHAPRPRRTLPAPEGAPA